MTHHTARPGRPPPPGAVAIDEHEVAWLCRCSITHLDKLIELGTIPPAMENYGALKRWNMRAVVEALDLNAGLAPVSSADEGRGYAAEQEEAQLLAELDGP